MVEIRKTIYTMAGKAEEQVKNKTGFLGHLVGAAEAAVKTGKDVAQRVQEEVEARGGLGKIANDVTDRLSNVVGRHSDGAEKVLDKTAERASSAYDLVEQKVRAAFFTNDRFDGGKAKAALKDGAKVAQEYGDKAAKVLAKIGRRGAEIVANDFRRYVPSQEERETTYAGIAPGQFLMRENCDACLAFAAKFEKRVPEKTMYRNTILKDIKEYACADVTDLMALYGTQNNAASSRKVNALTPFLKRLK